MTDMPKHADFYMDTVTFLVEDCLFKVPRGPFEKESAVFQDMFLLPAGELKEEGKSDDAPIFLAGITKKEFERLLSVLLYRAHGTSQRSLPQRSDQWESVFKLAKLWEFDDIVKVALDHLEKTMSPAGRVLLGEQHDLDFGCWTLPAMHEIVRRHKPISLEEGQLMGLELALKLASVREQLVLDSRYGVIPGRRPCAQNLDFKSILRETFERTID